MVLVQRFFWAFSGDGASKIAVLVTSIIAARALEPVQFGIYLGLYAAMLLAASLWDVGASTVVTRELAAQRITLQDAIRQSARLRARTLPIWALTFSTATYVVVRGSGVPAAVVVAFGAASLVNPTQLLANSVLRARLRFKAAAAAVAAGKWVTALLSLLAVADVSTSSSFKQLAFAVLCGEVSTLALAAAAIIKRRTDEQLTPANATSRITFRAAVPFAANSILSIAFNRLDIVILAALSTTAQVALYAPASRFQDALALIPGAAAAITLPLVAREPHTMQGLRAARRLLHHLVGFIFLLSVPTAILVFIYTPQLLEVVLGPQYIGATTSMRILVWFLLFSAVTAPLIAALAGLGHALDTTRILTAAFGTALMMHLLLDWWWGATGAAIASLSREPVALVVALLYARRAALVGSLPTSTEPHLPAASASHTG